MSDISRVLSNFIVSYEKMKQYKHFGAEACEIVKDVLEIGKKLDEFLDQQEYKIIPINIKILIIGGIWSNVVDKMDYNGIFTKYTSDMAYKKRVDDLIVASTKFDKLIRSIKEDPSYVS